MTKLSQERSILMNVHDFIETRELEEELEKIAMFGFFRKKTPIEKAKANFDKTLANAQSQAASQRKRLDKVQIEKAPPIKVPQVPESQSRKNAREKLEELKRRKGLL